MVEHLIVILGKVQPKERPRKGRYGNFYTPKATQDFEGFVHTCAITQGLKPFSKEQFLEIEFIFCGKYAKCDLDNLIKSVSDGFKEFFNDNKILKIIATKILSERYLTQVKIRPCLHKSIK